MARSENVIRWVKLLFTLVLAFFLTGCAALAGGEKTGPYGGEIKGQNNFSQLQGSAGSAGPGQATAGNPEKVIPVVLYFSDSRGYLVAVTKEITKTPAIARSTLQELCRGPAPGSGLTPTIPPGAVIRDINIKNGLAIVNFSRELKTKHLGGSSGELLTVYSIVNTLTQFPSVHRVQLLVEGERLETLTGHLDISQPLERDSSLIRPKG